MEAENNTETVIEQQKEHSLLVCIVNKGCTDLVMEAARKAGSRGGTITTARGTGNPDMASFYGIAIQPEKEMVFIVCETALKDHIMQKIYDEAGLDTKGQGIIFSLPVTDTVGMSEEDFFEEETAESGEEQTKEITE